MLAISPEGVALWITGIVAALIGAVVAVRKALRSERSADIRAKLEDDGLQADYWRRQYDLKVESDRRYTERFSEQIKELMSRCREAEEAHIKSRKEFAEAQGELVVLRYQNEMKDVRIAMLEEKLSKAGVE